MNNERIWKAIKHVSVIFAGIFFIRFAFGFVRYGNSLCDTTIRCDVGNYFANYLFGVIFFVTGITVFLIGVADIKTNT